MPSKFLNISVDSTLGGASPSDEIIVSQKAIKDYVDAHSSNVDIDNSTISTNSSDELQAIGLINKNTATGATSPIYDWVGTYAEYTTQNVATLHPEWVCFITDDSTGGELKANTNLDNLTEDGKNISNWSSNVTNCITEIPQDIKLELNSGTLTLKAGSKVCVPNGFEQDGVTPKFDFITTDSDLTYSGYMGITGVLFIMYNSNGLQSIQPGITKSGTTIPTTGCLYNTSTNKITKYVSGSITQDNLSFPICIINQAVESIITSIDQIFNGFGYIGSTVFVLPGLKGLIPDGRNADSTLKNTEIATNTVQTLTPTASLSLDVTVILEPETRQISYCGDPIYNEAENLTYDSTTKRPYCKIGRATLQASKITAFTPKTVFHAVDYNDTEYIAHQAMPSTRYSNLTLGATGTVYTAPADGFIIIEGNSTSQYSYILLGGNACENTSSAYAPYSGAYISATIAVRKNMRFGVWYQDLAAGRFRFYYANGAS